MQIPLNDEALNAVVTKAIFDSLTEETRAALIQNAVKSLLQQSENRYDRRTKLQEAFDGAVMRVAQDVAFKELGNDDKLREQVRGLFVEAWERITTGDARQKMIEKIATAMERALSGRDY